MTTTVNTPEYGAYLKATLELNDLTAKERQELEKALADYETQQQQPATVKLELTEAEVALIQEWSVSHILELENKLNDLERSLKLYEAKADMDSYLSIKDRLARLEQLLAKDTALDVKFWRAGKQFN